MASSAASGVVTKTKRGLWLIGGTLNCIMGCKLPSNRQVLCRFLHEHVAENNPIQSSATTTAREVITFWKKARIPSREEYHIIKKIKELHLLWKGLKKNCKRRTETQLGKENKFTDTLDDLFDVAHADALKTIHNEEDRAFLLAQRDKGRRGSMGPVDRNLEQVEKRRVQRIRKNKALRSQECARVQLESTTVLLSTNSNSDDSEEQHSSDNDSEEPPAASSTPGMKRHRPVNIVTPEVASALDRTQVSARNAAHVLAAAAQSLGHNPEHLALNRESIRRARRQHREAIAAEIKASFTPNVPLTVHWDGKMLPALESKENVDRLAILVSGDGVVKLLGVPQLANGTGIAQADAVFNTLTDWNLADRVQAMSFDTTASNTGRKGGACVLLEQKLEKELINLACRHHIHELIVAKVFDTLMGPSSGPSIKLFQRFADSWKSINRQAYESGIQDETVAAELEPVKEDLINFIRIQLAEFQPRDDYRELLHLALLFLGDNTSVGIHVLAPGAFHRARWMAKLIYCIKIFLFRSQFHLTSHEISGLRIFNVFIIRLYLKAWYTCQCAVSAPRNDLQLMKDLVAYKSVNKTVATAAITSFSGHLWYLNENLIGLSFFDDEVSTEMKAAMVCALRNEGETNSARRITLSDKLVPEKQLSDFVSTNTMKLFTAFNLPQDFLKLDSANWATNDDYVAACNTLRKLKVVNDAAERGVALIQTFNAILTNQEEQKQYLLQVVENHILHYPDAKKSTIIQGLNRDSKQ
jgi:hypothetical protein